MANTPDLKLSHLTYDFPISDLRNENWSLADSITIDRYWSGEMAPIGRQFKANPLWSNTGIYIRFEANQDEPFVVSDRPDFRIKTVGLWKRDVCEIFVAPNREEPRKYFEFEIAPSGEWLDLAIDATGAERLTNWEYYSGMNVAAQIFEGKVTTAMRIPWEAFGKKPKADDVWLGNIFRCVGKEPDRGYLAWQPTMTERPDFHVPVRFGTFLFKN